MISAPATPAWTAGVLLYGDDVIAGVAARIADPQTEAALGHRVGAVGAMALGTVKQDLAPIAARFLDLDLGSVLLTGWNKHRELLAAAARTQSPPTMALSRSECCSPPTTSRSPSTPVSTSWSTGRPS